MLSNLILQLSLLYLTLPKWHTPRIIDTLVVFVNKLIEILNFTLFHIYLKLLIPSNFLAYLIHVNAQSNTESSSKNQFRHS